MAAGSFSTRSSSSILAFGAAGFAITFLWAALLRAFGWSFSDMRRLGRSSQKGMRVASTEPAGQSPASNKRVAFSDAETASLAAAAEEAGEVEMPASAHPDASMSAYLTMFDNARAKK